MESVIKKALLKRGTLYRDMGAPLLEELSSFARKHDLDAASIASTFDKYMTTSGKKPSEDLTLDDVELYVEAYNRKSVQQPPLPAARTDNLFDKGPSWEDAACLLGGPPVQCQSVAPSSQRISPYLSKLQQARSAIATEARDMGLKGKAKVDLSDNAVVSILNRHIERPTQRISTKEKRSCKFESLGDSAELDSKYMMNRVEDKVDFLERRINSLENALEQAGVQIQSVAQAAQQQTTFVGRVCCDTEEGRLNPQSILLEGSMRLSGGSRARLDVAKCSNYRLFPGQVVAVQGVNPSGHCIIASEVVGGLPLPQQRTEVQKLQEFAQLSDQGLSVVIAVGPFTSGDDLQYEPLQALLDYCTAAPPHLLVLLGPFVDAEHPLVQAGLLEETFDDLFESRVLNPLRAFSSSNSGTLIKLMPSIRDAHHHPVFPQPPLDVGEDAISSLASPATFRCNEVVFGCSSSDWLLSCSSQEISKGAGHPDRLSALAAHLVSQRNYLPMFPASLPLDCSNAASLDLPCTPDLLLLPSDLQPFAKLLALPAPMSSDGCLQPHETADSSSMDVDGDNRPSNVVCVNPGRLVKGASGGTFAHLYTSPVKDVLQLTLQGEQGAASKVLHKVDQRCRVEIRRLQLESSC